MNLRQFIRLLEQTPRDGWYLTGLGSIRRDSGVGLCACPITAVGGTNEDTSHCWAFRKVGEELGLSQSGRCGLNLTKLIVSAADKQREAVIIHGSNIEELRKHLAAACGLELRG